jgi:hypothetical protein
MTDEQNELKRLALAAKDGNNTWTGTGWTFSEYSKATNPDSILSLLDRIKELEAMVEKLRVENANK